MPGDLDSHDDIVQRVDALLRRADAYDRFPTPVGDIVAAQALTESDVDLLSESMLAKAPAHLRAALRTAKGKVHAALDRREREIHVNPETDRSASGAFKRLHEVGHDLLDWQHIDDGDRPVDGFADDQYTLSPRTHRLFEQEANQAAAELLFQRDRLAQRAREYSPSMGAIVELADLFGASIHATFRRYIETHPAAVAGVVLEATPQATAPLSYRRREAICSSSWRGRFEDPALWPRDLDGSVFGFLAAARRSGSIGRRDDEWAWPDLNSDITALRVEAFNNSYSTLVLIWLPVRSRFKRRVQLAPAA